MQHGTHINHRIDVGILRGVAANGRGRIIDKEITQARQKAVTRLRRAGIRKGEQAPPCVGIDDMAKR